MIANLAVIVAAIMVLIFQTNISDLIKGFAIGGFVVKAIEIVREARKERLAAEHTHE